MAKRPAQPDPRQFSLEGYFEPTPPPELPGTMNFEHELRAGLNKAVKDSSRSRENIAQRMTELLGGDDEAFSVTKAMLDSWTGQSRTSWRFPLSYFPAFIQATGAYWLVDLVAQKCGCRALVGEDALFAEYGRLEGLENELRERKASIRKRLPKRPGSRA